LTGLGIALAIFATTIPVHAQLSFKSPQEAVSALVTAAKVSNRKRVLTILGPGAADIVSSGDEVADAAAREAFVANYDASNQIDMEGENSAVLFVGRQEWPFPIPLVRKNSTWQFDTAAGREEILIRRIGRNELSTIQACLAYVDAQDEYAEIHLAATGAAAYAQRIVSRPGRRDGLYWPVQGGAPESPLGELIGRATAIGYRVGEGRSPFNGYYFKILTRQGPAASGGAFDYVARGRMIGGFALVAYPAEYGNSGVMTFIVNHEGVVFQKNLGAATARIAEQMSTFNPDASWQRVEGEVKP
jgi:hypothetical protein